MLLKNCKYIITQDKNRQILKNYDILIEDDKIIDIKKKISGKGLNCKDKIVMPGIVNTHAHLGMHSLKGICDDETLFDWLEIVYKEEDKLSVDDILKNTNDGAIESIKNGTTCVYDSYKFAPERIEIFKKLGMRAFVSSTVTKEKHLKHIDRLLKATKDGIVKPIVAGHSPYRCTKELLGMIKDISLKYNLINRIHIAETKKECLDTVREHGLTPIRFLDSFGFLNEKTLLVHSTFVNDKEIDIIAKRNSSISHNPISNMKLGSGGVAPVVEMLKRGINVGLGTDSVVSNNDLDMFEELKVTALLHKHHNADPKAMTYQKVMDMATFGGAKALGLKDVGTIQKGKIADIITLDLDGLTPMNNIVSNIVYCANGRNVRDSIINGQLVMKNKKLQF
jgi:5-methylthioadenosine/S-adenosylhomocysteine deaminase